MQVLKKFIKIGVASDSLSGRDLPAGHTAVNYTPSSEAGEATANISAHIKGIDTALATAGGGESTGNTTLDNNQTSFTNVTGLSFNGASIRSVSIRYSISRATATVEQNCVGELDISYNTLSGTWSITNDATNSNAGITFDVTNAGQVTYLSSNISGTGYVGTIRWSAKTFGV
jgi:hypothetical protein